MSTFPPSPPMTTFVLRLRASEVGRPAGTIRCLDSARRVPVASWDALRREIERGLGATSPAGGPTRTAPGAQREDRDATRG